jgi:hypothetical protein
MENILVQTEDITSVKEETMTTSTTTTTSTTSSTTTTPVIMPLEQKNGEF